ncbi:hypothetical protein EV182_001415 [Spiromyces aspiralis]|uniref:Uncharacterized protein n=1 Tax=Spiromyces aspiralis TaxID=68401 RepID=A0ACC1HU03_9FUNG|nr:hypothetical protein EV182_001415 [Spiromyces aspiralis]
MLNLYNSTKPFSTPIRSRPYSRGVRQEFGKLAEENGTAVVSFAGFDCVPSDLGTLMLADYARVQYGKPLSHVKASVTRIRGGISDGTLASVTVAILLGLEFLVGDRPFGAKEE